MAFQICPDSNLSACCPLSHLLRKCQLSQGESREACANFLPYAQTKLVSPSGRDVAQRQRGLESAGIAFQVCPDSNLPAFCPLSHLLRKCQLSQRESQEAGADCTHAASGELLRRPARVLLLPSRLAPCHLPQGGRLWFSAHPKLVSPSGRDVAQRQRGLAFTYKIHTNHRSTKNYRRFVPCPYRKSAPFGTIRH